MRFFVAGAIFLLLALTTWGVHALSYHSKLTLSGIRIEGAERTPHDLIVSYINEQLDDGRFHFISRRNIFFYPKAALERALAVNFPRIASAHISREEPFSTTLIAQVEERKPYSRWCRPNANPCYWMDANGFVFAEVVEGEIGENTYVFAGGIVDGDPNPIGKTFAPTHVPGLIAVMRNLDNAGFGPTGATIESDQDFFVHLSNEFYIKASYGQDAGQLARNLDLVIKSETLRGKVSNLEYVDLRFGNRVYYKLKGELEVTSE